MSMAKARPRGWWYPYIFVGAFGVVLAVNLTLLYFATSTFNGLVTTTAFEEGVAYNREIAAARAQETLGWTAKAALEPRAGGVEGSWPADLVVSLTSAENQPLLRDLAVTAQIRRPTQAGFDQALTLTAGTDGRWHAPLVLPFAGQWEVRVVATRGQAVFRMRDRFVLTP
ncbi:integral membrane protein linked to a cation pump-like protein [Rhodospirillum rubrum F11]|uniref:Integral membrane protein linked to a cation pump-like n=2 Tax=Rhodospirillum rubrum TaxID=1085 RepID=Q2RP26_RHORT|nr:integral membrane protein linked to a cation pump-like [Rhodospirillum rubrum ATCC 11170]AEO49868.1 integral membrane protein linked to a cation pump-like protein [Rhodospirillum rubrum F11]MBK5955832.1 hypothetical protein [Rhodospirillum rubrum]QXG80063.1 FixH family protein [Rhodospirillum rubrum]